MLCVDTDTAGLRSLLLTGSQDIGRRLEAGALQYLCIAPCPTSWQAVLALCAALFAFAPEWQHSVAMSNRER